MTGKAKRTAPQTQTGQQKAPRFLLFAWFHLEQDTIGSCSSCRKRPGEVRFDSYQPLPDVKELLSMPFSAAEETVTQMLLTDQTAHGPRIHSSEPYCFPCVAEHVDAVMMGEPELVGMKTVVALTQRPRRARTGRRWLPNMGSRSARSITS